MAFVLAMMGCAVAKFFTATLFLDNSLSVDGAGLLPVLDWTAPLDGGSMGEVAEPANQVRAMVDWVELWCF